MRACRVSLFLMMTLVAILALAVASLVRPTPAMTLFTLFATASALLGSVLAAWIDRKSMFWRGFAVFGLGLIPLGLTPQGNIYSEILSRMLFPRLHLSVLKTNPVEEDSDYFGRTPVYSSMQPAVPGWDRTPTFSCFVFNCNCLTILTFGFSGGCLALLLVDRRDARLEAEKAKVAS